ncbi:MAG: ABC transporter ATP-binding protein [Myxococcales bacterium]|nr:ABC transporter ATP-binding protein [Myxococcales bacterium]
MSAPRSPLARLLAYARPYRRRIWLATFCSVLNKLFDLAPPVLIGAAVDVVVKREDSVLASWGIVDVSAQLWWLAAATVLIWGLESVFEYAYAVVWRTLAQTLQHTVRLDVYGHVQRLELSWFEDRSTGGLMSVLNDDVNQLERFLDGGANDLIQLGTTMLVVGGAFFVIAPEVAWLAMLPVPIIVWGSFRFQRSLAPRYAAVREQVGNLNALLGNNLSGMATIKSFTAEAREIERVRAESHTYRAVNRRAIALSSAFAPLIRMAIVIGFVATIVVGGQLVLRGDLAVGAYSVLVFITQRLLWPLTRLGTLFDQYQRAMASTTRILDLLDTETTLPEGEGALPTETVRGAVRFEGVDFAYRTGGLVLRGLDLDIAAGRTVAIVGATGAGKSSVIKLLLRFYDPTAGRITLDGHDLRTLRKADLRGAIGLVSQDVFLFHGTVRENIAYGRPDATDAQIEAAAEAAEALAFIRALPEGLDTIVGERGQKLSGGQRQRLSIARAVLKDPPVLVLDEATSAVDNETEAAIQRSMARIAAGRTTVVIAHRLSTIRDAHRIVVLDAGEVAETGTHAELVALGGIYAALWAVQTGVAAGAAEASTKPA